jgi:hypothetical protein
MAIAYDAFSNVTTPATGNISWTHTPTGTPKGVVVWVVADGGFADEITSVTYGGTAMTQVSVSPSLANITEDSSVHCFFLGASVPTGAQTVAVTTSASVQVNLGYCITLTAATAATAVQNSIAFTDDAATANPATTLTLSSTTCWVGEAGQTGVNTVGSVSPKSGWTARHEHDFGTAIGYLYTYDTVGSTNVTTIGVNQSSSSLNLIAVAVKEADPNQTIVPTKGSLALGGKIPTIVRPQVIVPTKGTLALGGKQPSLLLGRKIIPTVGHLVLGGKQPTLVQTANRWIVPTVGHLVLTGQTPTLVQTSTSFRVEVSWALLQAPLSTGTSIYPSVGHLTLNGKQPTLVQTANRTITPSVGHLVLTGRQPTVDIDRVVTPTVGHLTLTGRQPTLIQNVVVLITPTVGHLVLTGKQPTVTRTTNQTIAPSAGHLFLAGKQPTVVRPQVIVPSVGHLTLTGRQPTLTKTFIIAPTAGHLALGGYQPVLAQTAHRVIGPVTGHLSLLGYTPVISIQAGSQTITPAMGHLSLTGHAPTLSVGSDLGGRLIHRRRRYGVRNRIYEADVEEVAEIAEALNVPLEEVTEVTKGPERNRNGDGRPRNKDEFGYSFWYPHEVWGRASKGWQDKFVSPLGEDFFRAIEALKRAEQQKQQVYTAIQQQNNDLLLLLLMT